LLRTVLLLFSLTGIPRLIVRLMLDSRVPLRLKGLILLALLYLLSPIDFLPDIVPLLTHVDDFLVMLLAIGLFLSQAPRMVVREHLRGTRFGPSSDPTPGPSSKSNPTVIEGSYRYVDEIDDEQK
jgi:uncharacterized membrane protein YkvA (DUF1232 family)